MEKKKIKLYLMCCLFDCMYRKKKIDILKVKYFFKKGKQKLYLI